MTDRCKHCIYAWVRLSENGYHYTCTLTSKDAIKCITGQKNMKVTAFYNNDEKEEDE